MQTDSKVTHISIIITIIIIIHIKKTYNSANFFFSSICFFLNSSSSSSRSFAAFLGALSGFAFPFKDGSEFFIPLFTSLTAAHGILV